MPNRAMTVVSEEGSFDSPFSTSKEVVSVVTAISVNACRPFPQLITIRLVSCLVGLVLTYLQPIAGRREIEDRLFPLGR